LKTLDLTSELWPELERLFGPRGACGGCWCMFWRIADRKSWGEVQGETARRRFRALVRRGEATGVLCFDGDEPVGWLAYGPRVSFPRLERARTLRCDDAPRVWSLPCFYVKAGWRGKGVAGAMLAHALRSLRRRGAEIAEAYPVHPPLPGRKIPASFAYTGTRSLFAGAGFEVVGNRGGGRERVRLQLRRRR